jgi:hypothetical protein
LVNLPARPALIRSEGFAMATDDHLSNGRLDLVPMIDCVMLLLIFFVLTTKFSSPDAVIPALLPKSGSGPGIIVSKDQSVRVAAWPVGLPEQGDAHALDRSWQGLSATGTPPARARIRVGNRAPIELDGTLLGATDPQVRNRELERLHAYLAGELAAFEVDGLERIHQPQVQLHCFSGLPWSIGLALFDAVRAYEGGHQPAGIDPANGREDLSNARTVAFAAPRCPTAGVPQRGEELYEILHLR